MLRSIGCPSNDVHACTQELHLRLQMHLKARGWLYTCPRRWLRAAGSVSSLGLFPEGGSAGPAACRRGDRRRGDVSRGDCRGDCSASAVRIGEERRTRASEFVDGCPLLTLIFKYLHTACTTLVHGIGRNDHSQGMYGGPRPLTRTH